MFKKLLKVCERYIELFESGNMTPEDSHCELYYEMKKIVKEAKEQEDLAKNISPDKFLGRTGAARCDGC